MDLFENLLKLWWYPKKNTLVCKCSCHLFAFDIELFYLLQKTMWLFLVKINGGFWKKFRIRQIILRKRKLLSAWSKFQWEGCLMWKKSKFRAIFYKEMSISFLVCNQFWVCFNTSKGSKLPLTPLSKANRIKFSYSRTDLCQDNCAFFKTLQVGFRSYQILCPQGTWSYFGEGWHQQCSLCQQRETFEIFLQF